MTANDPSALSVMLGFVAFWAVVAAIAGAVVVIRRELTKDPAPAEQGSASPSAGADSTTSSGDASTPPPEPVIPWQCVTRGHAMALIEEHPRTFACAREGCTVKAVVEFRHVHISADLYRRLAAPTSEEDFKAARAEFDELVKNAPTQEEILDAAVEDLAGDIDAAEAFANGEGGAA